MYCSKCGEKIPDDSIFCSGCGMQINHTSLTATPSMIQTGPIYDRNVVVLHLRNLRFLEMARARLRSNLASVDKKIQNYGIYNQFREPRRSTLDSDAYWHIFGPLLVAVGVWIIGLVLNSIVHAIWGGHFFMIVAYVIMGALIIGSIGATIYHIHESYQYGQSYKLACAEFSKAIGQDQARVQWELEEKERLKIVRPKMYTEWQRVDALLKKSYDANIIPSQFRNLYAVYYLYDFLSTSHETLKEALLHCDLDEIKRKLDTIIQQQQQIILNQELQTAQLEGLRQQNDEILKHAIATEKNTHLTAQYTEVAAANTEALMYMSVAQYIRQTF